MKKYLFIFLVFCFCFCLAVAHAAVSKRPVKEKSDNPASAKIKTSEAVRSEAGLNIVEWGIAIDAIYDPRLDDLIPGYCIVNLVLTNRRGEPISFDIKQDKWYIIDHLGKKHLAQNHVKQFKPDLWAKMPQKMKEMLEYPQTVSAGKSTNIDVFLPKEVDLFHFKEVIWKSSQFDKEFSILTNYENDLALDSKKEFDLPKKITAEEELLLEDRQNQPVQNVSVGNDFSQDITKHPTEYPEAGVQSTTEVGQPQPLEIEEVGTTTSNTPPASVDGFIRVK